MKYLPVFIIALLLGVAASLRAAGPDDEYLSIYYLIQQGDSAADAGNKPEAYVRYHEAQTNLLRLQKSYPDWQNNIVQYRLKYLTKKISDLNYTPSAPTPVLTNATTPAELALQQQLAELQAQVQKLQSNNDSLQAKLREALSVRPAALDPAELAKAEQAINELKRENALMKVSLDEAQAKAAATAQGRELAALRKELVAANDQLAAETRRARQLAKERDALVERYGKTATSPRDIAITRGSPKELDEIEKSLATQQSLATQLQRERKSLLARITALEAEAANAATLRAENELLRRQVSELKAAAPTNSTSQLSVRLAAAEAQIAALQSERDILRLERTALENRVVALMAGRGVPGRDAQRVQDLERQLQELQQQLAEANGELARRADAKSAERADTLATQLAAMRARVNVLEAKPVAYSSEELALFRQSAPRLATEAAPRKGSAIPRPPAGSTALAAEAQRAFVRGDFAQAESKYQEVLRKDDQNVYTLANLAAIQLERGNLDDAEKNLLKALSVAPDDAYSLQTLGYLKFRQEKYDEALTQLSRAAQLDPENPEIQNYLGVTLSHRGQRTAAETALRRALQLQPGYTAAHNNLAVIYATQDPPAVALARWHYQKALAGGHPKNPQLEKLFEQKEAQPPMPPR
jgi:Flp pilus assembly protein TadD